MGGGNRGAQPGSLRDTVKTVANLLSQAPVIQHHKGAQELEGQGLYIGEGLPPVPPRLASKITKGEYMDMCDLLPEFWVTPHSEEEVASQRSARSRGRKRTQEIHVWLQCFALYAAVAAVKCLAEMMAYMIQIIWASQEYEGLAWFAYDEAYRRQAAVTQHYEWSRINPSIFSVCFTGRARRGQRCEWCLSASHSSGDCANGAGESEVSQRPRAIESAVGSGGRPSMGRSPLSGYSGTDACKLFNEQRCFYQRYKFRHICLACGGDHPASGKPECAARTQWRGTGGAGPVRQNWSGRGRSHSQPY